jgi:hypothetical protein
MWLFTETGFVSAVRKPWAKDLMTVRAREKESLRELAEMSGEKITTSKDSDYPHRIVVADKVFKIWLIDKIDTLDYDNFKNRVAKTRGQEFAHVLSEIWYSALQLEDLDKDGRVRKIDSSRWA